MRHKLGARFKSIQARTWAVVAVVAVLFSFGWTLWINHLTEESLTAKVQARDEANARLYSRISTLEEYYSLCRNRPEECRQVAPPVEEIQPESPPAPRLAPLRPTFSQVQAATLQLLPGIVANYCKGGRCDGKAGKDSEVPGPEGQVGPQGPAGEQGPAGADAPRITSISCSGMSAPDSFTFRYSDGSEQQVECEMLPPVEEEP